MIATFRKIILSCSLLVSGIWGCNGSEYSRLDSAPPSRVVKHSESGGEGDADGSPTNDVGAPAEAGSDNKSGDRGGQDPLPCVARPDQSTTFSFLLGGQSNAVRLSQQLVNQRDILTYELINTFQGVIDPAKIKVFTYAANSTSLDIDWKPNGTASSAGDGKEYTMFQTKMRSYLDAGSAVPRKNVPAGMFWMQGESDSMDQAKAARYESNLALLIKDARVTFGHQSLPFVVGRLSLKQNHQWYKFVGKIREAQDAVGKNIPGVRIANLDDIEISSDQAHFTAEGYKAMAKIFAERMKVALFPGLEQGAPFCDVPRPGSL